METGSGKYTTQGDGGIDYRYDATWEVSGAKILWSARVQQHQGVLVRLIEGEFDLDLSADVETAVRCRVENAIEELMTRRAPKLAQILDAQRKAFKKKFGRAMQRHDPVFFDPDADEPRPIPVAQAWRAEMLRAMKQSGFPPPLVYAYEKTGFIVNDQSYDRMRPEDRRQYNRAIGEYARIEDEGKKPTS
jgi:hypothetical protein